MQSHETMREQERRPEKAGMRPPYITAKEAVTPGGLFRARVAKSADKVGYKYYDSHNKVWRELTWSHMAKAAARWQDALSAEGLVVGDRLTGGVGAH